MSSKPEDASTRHTRTRPIRVPGPLWDAYGRICKRLGTDRTNDLLDHMRARIAEHGDEQDFADLEAAAREVAERRARKGGRPPRAEPERAGHNEGTRTREAM